VWQVIDRVTRQLVDPEAVEHLVINEYATCAMCHPPKKLP
jgi:hypothetical protein